MGAPPGLGPVVEYLAGAEGVAERLGYADPALRPAYHKHLMMLLSLAYIEVFGTCVETPDWVPHIPFYLPWGSPNPDDVYRFAPIDPAGRYRLEGSKGTAAVGLVTLRKGGAHLGEINGRTLAEIDLTTIEADASGRYAFILSAERPAGYAGVWVAMHPETNSLLYRSRTNDASQVDASCKIFRLDLAPQKLFPAAAEVEHKMAMLARYAGKQNELLLGYLNAVRARGGDTGFVFDDQSNNGGVIHQRVLMTLFELAEDEALILESELPGQVRYWSVQVYDPHFMAIDFVFHQTTLNGDQVRVDADGRVRLVVAAEDPGVANWLDTAGWPKAGMLWRWSYADAFPRPSLRKVKLSEVAGLLPEGTVRVTPAERAEGLAERARYYQTRGR